MVRPTTASLCPFLPLTVMWVEHRLVHTSPVRRKEVSGPTLTPNTARSTAQKICQQQDPTQIYKSSLRSTNNSRHKPINSPKKKIRPVIVLCLRLLRSIMWSRAKNLTNQARRLNRSGRNPAVSVIRAQIAISILWCSIMLGALNQLKDLGSKQHSKCRQRSVQVHRLLIRRWPR